MGWPALLRFRAEGPRRAGSQGSPRFPRWAAAVRSAATHRLGCWF